jgi:exopolysaccharide biosynthesis polyprenyl glycosylphosphotransferase
MQQSEQYAGRRLLLLMADAALAFGIGLSLASNLPRNLQILFAICWASIAVAALSVSGSYVHLMRKEPSTYGYAAGVAAILAGLTAEFILHRMNSSSYGDTLRATALLFVALLSIRLLLLWCHRELIGTRKLWIIAEDALRASNIAAKMRDHALFYEVCRSSRVPSEEDLPAALEGFDSVMCTPSVRPFVEESCKVFGIELLLVPDTSDVLTYSARAHQVDDLLILSLPGLRLTTRQRWCKRALDVLVAIALILLCAPLMLVLYLAIPLDSEGPAIFRQSRRGLQGRSFEILKFRTMAKNAEHQCGPVLASKRDPRITRLGRILRATRLDELPQLFNVLRGEMSLVGPRPEREFFARAFDAELPNYRNRVLVQPGLTGLAQVWGRYSTSADDKLRLDLTYIANYSFMLDLNLLLHTVKVVLQGAQSDGVEHGTNASLGFESAGVMEEANKG